MLIIVEGIDKTGKTTLINYLLKNISNAYTLKNGDRPKNDSYIEREKIKAVYWKILEVYKHSFTDSVLILDRFFVSELVYCRKRGYDALKDDEMKLLKEELENRKDIIIIHCKTDIENIKNKFIEDEEDYVLVKEIEFLSTRYDEILGNFKIFKLPYDYTITTPEQVVTRIKLIKEGLEK